MAASGRLRDKFKELLGWAIGLEDEYMFGTSSVRAVGDRCGVRFENAIQLFKPWSEALDLPDLRRIGCSPASWLSFNGWQRRSGWKD
jgi:hypothetical protein